MAMDAAALAIFYRFGQTMALCQHRAHHAGVATARRTGVYGLGRVSLDMNRLATWLTNPSAAGADTHHQRRAQCSAQAVAQLVHEVVKSAANGDFAVVDWRTKSLGQRHGLPDGCRTRPGVRAPGPQAYGR